MKLCILLIVSFAAFASTHITPIKERRDAAAARWVKNSHSQRLGDITIEINSEVDEIVSQIDTFIVETGLDPYKLEDICEGFSFQPLIITYHGELELTHGWLQDISTMRRNGNSSVTISSTYASILIPIAFNDLMFSYDYYAKVMDIGPVGDLDGYVRDVEILADIRFDMETNRLKLETFKITKAGSINLKFNGNPIMDALVDIFTDLVTFLLHDLVVGIAQNVVKEQAERFIDSINELLQNNSTKIAY